MAALGVPSSFSHFEVLVSAWNLQRRPLQSRELPILLLRRCSSRRKVQLVLMLTASGDYKNASAFADLHVRVTPDNSIAYATRTDTCGLSASLQFFRQIVRLFCLPSDYTRAGSLTLANGTVLYRCHKDLGTPRPQFYVEMGTPA